MENALEVEGLGVAFGRSTVLRDLTFAVPAGSALAIIGPNGAGKTVLFRALIGVVRHRGEVRWKPGTRIGYVPQKLDIDRGLPVSGREFLAAKAAVSGAAPAEIDRVLALVNLPARVCDGPIGAHSGGQFQRLLLAASLIGSPGVLLFDEPTAGVDEPGEERLYEMIHRVQSSERLTLLFISHELSVVFRYATSVLCLGQDPAWLGPPEVVLTPERIQQLYGAPVGFHHH